MNAYEEMLKGIKYVLDNCTAYRVSKDLNINARTINRYQNGTSPIENMSLETAKKIYNYYEEMFKVFINLKSIGLNGEIEVGAKVIERLHKLFESDDSDRMTREIEHEVGEVLENMDINDELKPGIYREDIVIATEYENDAFSYDVEEFVLKFEVSQFKHINGIVTCKKGA